MTRKRIMSIIALIIVGAIAGFIFLLYATIKTKSTSLNSYQPYKEWLGKTVTLRKQTVLFKEKIRTHTNSNYPYMLLDSLHPQWQYKDEQIQIGDIEEIIKFPAGTPLKFNQAIQYTNGVSGSSYPTIFGTVTFQGKKYKVGYQWGNQNIAKHFGHVEKSWQFHQAPWQEQVDTTYYALPTANFW